MEMERLMRNASFSSLSAIIAWEKSRSTQETGQHFATGELDLPTSVALAGTYGLVLPSLIIMDRYRTLKLSTLDASGTGTSGISPVRYSQGSWRLF